jgi:hypothetical protein
MLMRTVQAMAPELSAIEWQTVALALNDAGTRAMVRPGGDWMAGLWRIITGASVARPLADPRLEALRGFVCDARRRRRIDITLAEQLLQHGFNTRQIEAIALLVG